MLDAKASQFTLSPEGQILWQEKVNNPAPGVAVAGLEKGAHILKPEIKIIENEHTAKHDQTALMNNFKLWLETHFKDVLEPLMLLEVPKGQDVKEDAVSKIAASVYDGLGIVPRADLEGVIAELTTETRTELRSKKIRLGPILVFIPALNKPAAVKLRALLWSLYHGKDLPASVPADGIVSVVVEDKDANADYYRSIGYPLYGGRAVRIDMLDRVISCVYDNAEGGKFQARHEMAEWLGSTIEDLYKVLEDMGHTKIHDPADEKPQEEKKPEEGAEAKKEGEGAEKKEQVKPELATFRLKKGKAFQTKGKGDDKRKPKKKKEDGGKKKDFKKKKKKDDGPRVIKIEAKTKDEDNPFAVLQQLKK